MVGAVTDMSVKGIHLYSLIALIGSVRVTFLAIVCSSLLRKFYLGANTLEKLGAYDKKVRKLMHMFEANKRTCRQSRTTFVNGRFGLEM